MPTLISYVSHSQNISSVRHRLGIIRLFSVTILLPKQEVSTAMNSMSPEQTKCNSSLLMWYKNLNVFVPDCPVGYSQALQPTKGDNEARVCILQSHSLSLSLSSVFSFPPHFPVFEPKPAAFAERHLAKPFCFCQCARATTSRKTHELQTHTHTKTHLPQSRPRREFPN